MMDELTMMEKRMNERKKKNTAQSQEVVRPTASGANRAMVGGEQPQYQETENYWNLAILIIKDMLFSPQNNIVRLLEQSHCA